MVNLSRQSLVKTPITNTVLLLVCARDIVTHELRIHSFNIFHREHELVVIFLKTLSNT